MTVSDLKLKLFRQIDSLEKGKLEEIYGVLLNYINGQKDVSEWDKLSDNQKQVVINVNRDSSKLNTSGHDPNVSSKPSLQEWAKNNPGKSINDYYSKYGR